MSLATVILPSLARVEEGFQFHVAQKWVDTYWMISFPICAAYLIIIFSLQSLMKSQKPIKLRFLLPMWNVGLAVFSFIGAVACIPDLVRNVILYGIEHGNCCSDTITTQRVHLWMFLFMLSKVVELGDTLFVVLRKSPLQFLHWYHHITVLIYCWYSFRTSHEFGIWFGGINYFIHTIMYSYYAVRAMGFRVPSVIPKVITILQILQMFIGIILSVLSLRKSEVFDCEVPHGPAYSALVMYITYMILFLKFFYQKYIRRD